jgi:hypothetical protein|tara:strand:+ start:2128 stop:2355 length:228 start_codon:yes stop_codon:yes gene_type:complete
MMSDLTRSEVPHSAVIRIQIKIHQQLKDGSLSPKYLSVDELNKLGIAPCAEMKIDGFDRNSCVKNVLDKLEKLNG